MTQKALSLKKNMLWNSAGSLVNLGCQWLITVLIVRMANGYESAGIFSLAVSIYGMFYPLAQYRMYTYQVSDIKGENSPGEYLCFRLGTCLIALALCAVYSFLTCSQEAWSAILLYGSYRSVSLVIDVLHACDQLEKRMDYIGKSLAMQGIASLISFSVAFTISNSLEISLVCMTISVLAIGFFYDRPRTLALCNFELGLSQKKALHLFSLCLPVVIAGMAASAMPSIPRQTISIVFDTEALGAYASVAAPVAIIQMGASYIYSPLLTYYSESYINKDAKTFYRLVSLTLLAVFLMGILLSIAMQVAGGSILVLVFGTSIEKYIDLMYPMVLLAIITGFYWFMGELMITLRSFRCVFVGNMMSLAAAILLAKPLILAYGLNGATYSTILATVTGMIPMAVAFYFLMHSHWRESNQYASEK